MPFPDHPATNPGLLKQINTARLLELLRCHAPITRADLARLTGLTRSTVTVITAELIAQGLVRESGDVSVSRGGRPGVGLMLNPNGAFFIGAAIEVEHLTVLKLNLAAQIVMYVQEPLANEADLAQVLRQLMQLVDRVRQADGANDPRLRGIGLSIQGTLNLDGVILRAPFLNWAGGDLRRYLEPQLTLPLFVDNDANAAALAEVYLGNATRTTSLLYILINKGVGSGIVIHNQVFRGAYGTAGEIAVLMSDPPQDDLEQWSYGLGKEALLDRYRAQGGRATGLPELVEQLAQGEAIAHTIVQSWAETLGRGIISAASLLNPEQIVLGGPLTVLFPYVKATLMTMLRDQMPRQGEQGFFSNPKAKFDASAFGADASAVGGAVLAYQSLFRVPDLVLLPG